jgi:hypothetical protein
VSSETSNRWQLGTGTAHQRVAKAAGITPVVAGSTKLQRRVMRAG